MDQPSTMFGITLAASSNVILAARNVSIKMIHDAGNTTADVSSQSADERHTQARSPGKPAIQFRNVKTIVCGLIGLLSLAGFLVYLRSRRLIPGTKR